ncbi:MAG: quinolinate synthase NadA [Chitinivibrionales bacterium]|nr:quinolinate synthase NadA [Chitinivibrionales bacterium]
MDDTDTELIEKIKAVKHERNALILAHTYQPGPVQDCADFVGDSYGLSVQAAQRTDVDMIVFCGVSFMAETAYLLSPAKKVVLAAADAGCPMADMIEPEQLRGLQARYPGAVTVCYVNTSAAIKALSDVCCTSSNAVTIVATIPAGRRVIFVPDKHLGSWVQEQTKADMILWDGLCPIHYTIQPSMIEQARKQYPQAVVLIHPEATKECRDRADAVLSTSGMCTFAATSPAQQFIIATEIGILHTLAKQCPGKQFFPASRSASCVNMKKCSLDHVYQALLGNGGRVVTVDSAVAEPARKALRAMIAITQGHRLFQEQ